jgi:hypothetical protein
MCRDGGSSWFRRIKPGGSACLFPGTLQTALDPAQGDLQVGHLPEETSAEVADRATGVEFEALLARPQFIDVGREAPVDHRLLLEEGSEQPPKEAVHEPAKRPEAWLTGAGGRQALDL